MEPTYSRNLSPGINRFDGIDNRNKNNDYVFAVQVDKTNDVLNSSSMALNNSYYGAGAMMDDSLLAASNLKKKRVGDGSDMNHNSSLSLVRPDGPMNMPNNISTTIAPMRIEPNYLHVGSTTNQYNPTIQMPNNAQVVGEIQLNSGFNKSKMDLKPPIMQGRPVARADMNQLFSPNMPGLDKLNLLSRIFVKQKFEMLEMLTGCETENRYKVYAADQGLERVGRPIFKCKEKSSFLARNCLSGDCRPFQMKIIHEDREEDEDDDDMFLLLDRPCRCTVCCMNRPEITITLKEGGANKYLGKVLSDWACCDMLFTVLDYNGRMIYKIRGDSCQWGLYCNCPFESCSKIVFNIQSPEGEPVGEIYKIYAGAVKEFLTDTDNFCCVFPNECSPEHKALLLAVVLFIDFRYFEQSPAQNNGVV